MNEDFNQKDYLIYKYGKYNYAIAKSIAELFNDSNTIFYIKFSVKLLHYLHFISGKLDLPRFGVYTKTRLAKIASRELGVERGIKFCSIISSLYNVIDRKLIKDAICWNILNTENFATNKFKME